jgi:hypothetical protein
MRIRLVCVLASVVAGLCSAQGVGTSITVCEALANPQRFTTQIVRIEGEFSSGWHGMFFSTFNCQNIEPRLRHSMCIVPAGQFGTPSVPFSTSTGPLLAVASATRTLLETNTGFRSTAVIEGQLFVAESGGAGFCANRSSQAMLVARNLVTYSTSQANPDR